MNPLDWIIGAVSPRAGIRRVVARKAYVAAKRSYEAAGKGTHLGGWTPRNASADTEIATAGPVLRARMRDLVRRNAYAAKAISSLETNLVGDGILPTAENKRANDTFAAWAAECDADGHLDFYGLQSLACREMLEAGEVFIRRRIRRASDGMTVPLQIQVLEADFLDDSVMKPSRAGNAVVSGVEFDRRGRRVGYWMFPEHPGNSVGTFAPSRFVPAEEIIHLYEKQRTQIRGVPWGTPAIVAMNDLDDYELAEARRKKHEASVVGVVTSDDDDYFGVTGTGPDGQPLPPGVLDSDGNIVEEMQPGLFLMLRRGKDIKFNQPAATPGYADNSRVTLHKVAAGFRIPYELLTGDLSQVNYSSIRAGLVEFRRLVSKTQWQILIPVMCEPLWNWFTEAAWMAGKLPSPIVDVKWSPPAWVSPDPLKDEMAAKMALRAGTQTIFQVVGAQGRDTRAHLEEYAEGLELLDALGLTFDWDVRRVAGSGALQASASAPSEEDEDVPEEGDEPEADQDTEDDAEDDTEDEEDSSDA